MNDSQTVSVVQRVEQSPAERPPFEPEIDLEALAAEIVALLKEQVWLERDRGGERA